MSSPDIEPLPKAAAPAKMGAALLPDICIRVAGSVDSVTAIVNDRRQYWSDYLASDKAKLDPKTCELIKGLLKLYAK